MIRLEKLLVRKLGNVAPNTELRFGERGVLLLGRNGTGKTTLLNTVTAVLTSDWRALKIMSDDFDIELTISISSASAPEIRIRATVKENPTPEKDRIRRLHLLWDFVPSELTVEIELSNSKKIRISTSNEQSTVSAEVEDSLRNGATTIPQFLSFLIRRDNETLSFAKDYVVELEELSDSLVRLDEATRYLDGLTEDYPDPPELVTFLLSKEQKLTSFKARILSKNLVSNFLQAMASHREEPQALTGENIALANSKSTSWIAKFCKLCHFDELRLSLSLITQRTMESHSMAYYGPLNLFYGTHGTTLTERGLSFGQKRLFSILHYLDANPSVIVADEIVNGMHHEWIDYCIEELQKRQSFLSTQNPILFDFWTFKSADDAANCFVECSCDESGRFIWCNMPIADAVNFYEAYRTGIQHVSEILRTRGYW